MMALRISATGFVKSLLFLLMVLTILRPGSVAGSRTRLWHGGGSGVRGGMVADRDCPSWRSRERLVAGDELELGRKGWRKLLFARRRRNAAAVAVVESRKGTGEPAAPNVKELQGREASGLSHFAAAFRFFSSMAKGSPSPSPATPSPGHN